MKIEQQVVSLELAKQLKAAGYPQNDSYWSWAISSTIFSCPKCDYEEERFPQLVNTIQCMGPAYSETIAAAPSVAELGEKLPYRIREKDNDYWLDIQKLKHGGWDIRYKTSGGLLHGRMTPNGITQADTEADARGKMWLYVKEKGLL